ncbi:prolipoprotein diacylglyceryl transferase [Chitinophaga nivalis]|uniref:Phosphatidylglycerol--prolipoprotein diacylglyceryl transferase n=1 Tax=Chitinophaga nivalis TaxID=2991709 RepID=A0ABT3IP22_9BACT|nr:prolipoprotein diacylglyceryl transferase [Chitinophaga nivalis]MCW3464589.1 prolipoprotein diacylglyceryl transferase [Chitinophaga nivalis]MCW3485720.1 prolipoprotein diacylglyceryl transferase [Chitinophaga nivalis]
MMMLYLQWRVAPEIFHIGSFALRYYSVAFMAAFLVSYVLLSVVFRREGTPPALLEKLTIYIFVGTLAGARLGHCLFYDFDYYRYHLWEIILPVTHNEQGWVFTGYQGLASHGGAIGILLAAALFCRRYQVPYSWLLDRLALAVPFAGCLIRIGNFFNAEIIGIPTQLPWAVIFTRVDNIPRHPAQLYEALCYAVIGGWLWYAYRYKQALSRPGTIFGWLLMAVFSVRFGLEFIKENQAAFENGHLLNMGQLLSIPLIAIGIYCLYHAKRKYGKREPD